MLDQGAKLIEARFPGQPDLQAELYGVVSRTYADIGADKLAMDYARRQLLALDVLPPDAPRRVGALLLLANSALAEGREQEAGAYARQAIVHAGNDRALAAQGHALRARVALRLGNLIEASASIALAEAELGAPEVPPTIAAAWLLDAKASLLARSNRFAETGIYFSKAVAVALAVEGDTSRTATDLQVRRARTLVDRNRYAEAKEQFDAALARTQAGNSPTDRLRAAVLTVAFWTRAYEMRAVSFEAASAAVGPVREALLQASTNVPRTVQAGVDYDWAQALLFHGDIAQAQALMDTSVPVLMESVQSTFAHLGFAVNRGELAMLTGDHDAAEAALKEAVDLRGRMGMAKRPYTAYEWARLALNEIMRGDSLAAQEWLARAPRFGVDDATGISYGAALDAMRARVLLDTGHADAAIQAMPVHYRAGKDDFPLLPFGGYFGEALCAASKPAQGLAVLQASMRSLSEVTGPNDPNLARLRALAGLCSLTLRDRQQARRLADQSRLSIESHLRLSPWFEQPLLKLEQALGQRPSSGKEPSVKPKRNISSRQAQSGF